VKKNTNKIMIMAKDTTIFKTKKKKKMDKKKRLKIKQ